MAVKALSKAQILYVLRINRKKARILKLILARKFHLAQELVATRRKIEELTGDCCDTPYKKLEALKEDLRVFEELQAEFRFAPRR